MYGGFHEWYDVAMPNDDDKKHRQLMDAHALRREVDAVPVSEDRKPSGDPLKFQDDGSVVLCGMRVRGCGFVVLRVLPLTNGVRTIGVSVITEGEAERE